MGLAKPKLPVDELSYLHRLDRLRAKTPQWSSAEDHCAKAGRQRLAMIKEGVSSSTARRSQKHADSTAGDFSVKIEQISSCGIERDGSNRPGAAVVAPYGSNVTKRLSDQVSEIQEGCFAVSDAKAR
jgi:hypothetical protein